MTPQRKFKVTTSITQYMWACSREDAGTYQGELIQPGAQDLLRDSQTELRFCFSAGQDFLEAPRVTTAWMNLATFLCGFPKNYRLSTNSRHNSSP